MSAAGGRQYKHFCIGPYRYNCNDWCEDVASGLGYRATVTATCSN